MNNVRWPTCGLRERDRQSERDEGTVANRATPSTVDESLEQSFVGQSALDNSSYGAELPLYCADLDGDLRWRPPMIDDGMFSNEL
ncbi:MAG: hypothetical protein HY791_15960 [Deltaproteobacteria bacterium]|nr:hypothetical protein [Deltaproteobacteria bacterium]